jgi:hypothetical protein
MSSNEEQTATSSFMLCFYPFIAALLTLIN